MSTFFCPGPVKKLRGTLPNGAAESKVGVPKAERANAAGLK